MMQYFRHEMQVFHGLWFKKFYSLQWNVRISRYFSDTQYYFQVNDRYVRNKLKVVLFPFLHRVRQNTICILYLSQAFHNNELITFLIFVPPRSLDKGN